VFGTCCEGDDAEVQWGYVGKGDRELACFILLLWLEGEEFMVGV